ncbi:hypothetical protein [uncultured Chitinophaga sp.]|jgi:hypothetical protein|uniref:nSTAND1 domain-containing NTPase n=1 Tax=uncultured Chitinophaga sp. TaxID=339340 RepID=UPI002606489E|nr:hypothetical protein [uncultured Chitinophaga sp.]
MSDNAIRKSRYPGVVAFEENQHQLFFGRKTETKELIQLLKAERTIVLFAKSGIGKSSLLNAGLIPYMQAEGFYPIKVRFQYTGDNPDKDTIRKTPLKILDEVIHLKMGQPSGIALREEMKVLFDNRQPRLWELFKRLKFPSYQPKSTGREQILQAFREEQSAITGTPAQRLPAEAPHMMTPVLIFDQFEEFFNFSTCERHDFLVQLSELLHEMCPNRILEWLRSQAPEIRTPEMVEWSKQPLIKCIFAIRDDKLAELDGIRKYIPLILRNRYRLFPLDYYDAREAMTEPAKVEGDFVAPKFSFDEQLLDAILRKLCGRAPELSPLISQPPEDNSLRTGVDGSQLQKICTYIEHKVIERHRLRPYTSIVVDETLIKQEEAEHILDRFYEDQLKKIGNEKDIDICRRIIEDNLVAGGGRTSLTDNQMKQLLKDRQDLLDKMMDVRLVREEFTHLGRTYELSHDTLVKAVTKYAEQHREARLRKDKDRQVRYKLLFLALALVSLACMILVLQMSAKNERILNKSKGWLAEKYYTENNHYMAFRLWSSYQRVGLFDTKARDSVRKLLDSRFFFDISGGTQLHVLNPATYVTLEAENRINIWRLPEDGAQRLLLKAIADAMSLEVADSRGYFICRDKGGRLVVYDVNTRNAFSIPHAQLKNINTADRNSDFTYGSDFKAGFLPGSDFIWYLTEAGDTYLFDLKKRKKINYSFTTGEPAADSAGSSRGILYTMKMSPDGKLLAVFKKGLLRIYSLPDAGMPLLQDSISGITWLDVKKHKDWLVYGTSLDLYTSSARNGWRHAAAKRMDCSFWLPAQDTNRLIFNSRPGALTIYNLLTETIDTTIADYARRSAGSSLNAASAADRPRSFSCMSSGIVRYTNGQGKTLYYSLAEHRYIQGISNATLFSAGARYYAYADATGLMRVFDTRSGKELFRRLTADAAFSFDDTETRLAYLRTDSTKTTWLEVVSLPAGQRINRQVVGAEVALEKILDDQVARMTDIEGNSGILFLNGERRGYHYFNDRYPLLSTNERTRVGIE